MVSIDMLHRMAYCCTHTIYLPMKEGSKKWKKYMKMLGIKLAMDWISKPARIQQMVVLRLTPCLFG